MLCNCFKTGATLTRHLSKPERKCALNSTRLFFNVEKGVDVVEIDHDKLLMMNHFHLFLMRHSPLPSTVRTAMWLAIDPLAPLVTLSETSSAGLDLGAGKRRKVRFFI